MIRAFLILLSCVSLFAQRTPLKVNGTVINNPNFTNSPSVTYSVAGANISATATGGGDTIWTNDNGTIRATSPVADNGSAAFSITASNTLTQDLSKLFSITNGANGGVFHIGRNGGLMVGPNTENFWLGGTDAGETLLSFNDTTQGDPDFFSIFTGVGNPAGVYNDIELWGQPWHASVWVRSFTNNNETLTAIELYAGTNDTRIAIRTGNTTNVIITPTAAAGVTPFFYGTSLTHTSGNLNEIANNSTNKHTVDFRGTVTAGLRAFNTVAPTIVSATTIAPVSPVNFISGTTAIDTITAPTPISVTGGQITLIPTGLWTTTTSGNIALATTAVVSKALTLFYDATTTKWYPSY